MDRREKFVRKSGDMSTKGFPIRKIDFHSTEAQRRLKILSRSIVRTVGAPDQLAFMPLEFDAPGKSLPGWKTGFISLYGEKSFGFSQCNKIPSETLSLQWINRLSHVQCLSVPEGNPHNSPVIFYRKIATFYVICF